MDVEKFPNHVNIVLYVCLFFFGVCFLFSFFSFFFFFFVSHGLGILVNSLQLVSEPRVRFEWEQWQRKQERRLK